MQKGLRIELGARPVVAGGSLIAGILFVALASAALAEPFWRQLFVGTAIEVGGTEIPYPFTIQNLMWLILFLGLGELLTRILQSNRESGPLQARLLPEDPEVMLRARDLGPIYKRLQEGRYSEDSFLPRLIGRTILQFQSSRSVDQANSLLNSTLELCQHEIDLRYNMLRYLVWLIPTLGFIGTVVGIALALQTLSGVQFSNNDEMQAIMPQLTERLGVAFFTTLLALLQSAVLVFALHVVQAREERILNRAGQYCLDNLINRLYEK